MAQAIQVLIAIAMVDVWLLRYAKPLRARGGNAQTMEEEFRVYGLPDWFRDLMRFLKLTCAALLVGGIWIPWLALVGGLILSLLMSGAVLMHVKIRDPLLKSVPAAFFLALSLYVVYTHWGVPSS